MTHVTCRLTAKNRDQLWNSTLGNRVWATFLVVVRGNWQVQIYDQTIFESYKSPGQFFHASSAWKIDHFTIG